MRYVQSVVDNQIFIQLGLGHKCYKNSDCEKGTKYSKCGNMNYQKNTLIVVKASARRPDKHKLSNKSKHSYHNLFHSSSSPIYTSSKLSNTARTGYRSISRQSKVTKMFKDSSSQPNVCRCLAEHREDEEKANCLKIENKQPLMIRPPAFLTSVPLIASANSINEQFVEKPSMLGFNSSLSPVSVGKPCTNSYECKLRDPYAHCVNGVCDCMNRDSKCSAQNTGCHDSTFQCRDGSCISWYFVCDKQNSKFEFV